LEAGEVFTVRDLVTAMMVKSANDAAAALAEGIAGSREAYVQRMRDKARALGLADTEVYTPHGLPTSDTGVPEDRSSPMDLARMGAEVLRYPELRLLVSTRLAPFRHGEFELFNPNRLLGRYAFATGIKTGYHVGADFCRTAPTVSTPPRRCSRTPSTTTSCWCRCAPARCWCSGRRCGAVPTPQCR